MRTAMAVTVGGAAARVRGVFESLSSLWVEFFCLLVKNHEILHTCYIYSFCYTQATAVRLAYPRAKL